MSRFWESNLILLDCHTGDRSPGYLRCGPLKEVREEHVAQRVLHGMELPSYVWGDTLHKIPLLMGVLPQA